MNAQVSAVLVLYMMLAMSTTAQLVPTHVYLSLTGNLTQMQLTFTTSAAPPSAVVNYYPTSTPSQKNQIVVRSTDTVLFVTPFNVTEYITSVTMTSLTAATEYTYSISANSSQPPQATYTFKTLPSDDDPVNILMYGDLGAVGVALAPNTTGGIAAWAAQRRMDFIIHYGDLAYNLATNNGTVGDLFMKNIINISATYPYVVLPGNHEYMDHANDEAMYRGWFRGQLPLGINSASVDPAMWHSYDIGSKLHMVGINTEVYCEDPQHVESQWYWLEKDLALVQARAEKPWVVVYGHRQMYEGVNSHFHTLMMRLGVQCTDDSHTTCNFSLPCLTGKYCAYSLEALFQKYSVDLFVAGHMHSYVRMFPVSSVGKFENQDNHTYINAMNTAYIISGAAGDQHQPAITAKTSSPATGATPTAFEMQFGYSLSELTVFNSTHLKFQQVQVLDNQIVDELWMIKDSSKPIWKTLVPFTLGNVTEAVCNQ